MPGYRDEEFLKCAFELYDTHGLPLEILLSAAGPLGLPVSLPHFYEDALAHGWSREKALRTIEHALADAGRDPKYVGAAIEYLRLGLHRKCGPT